MKETTVARMPGIRNLRWLALIRALCSTRNPQASSKRQAAVGHESAGRGYCAFLPFVGTIANLPTTCPHVHCPILRPASEVGRTADVAPIWTLDHALIAGEISFTVPARAAAVTVFLLVIRSLKTKATMVGAVIIT